MGGGRERRVGGWTDGREAWIDGRRDACEVGRVSRWRASCPLAATGLRAACMPNTAVQPDGEGGEERK